MILGLPRWLSGKESTCQCRRHGFSPWVGKIPWRRKWQLTAVFLPGESHGQRSLVGYSPWSRTESDRTERTHVIHYCRENNLTPKSWTKKSSTCLQSHNFPLRFLLNTESHLKFPDNEIDSTPSLKRNSVSDMPQKRNRVSAPEPPGDSLLFTRQRHVYLRNNFFSGQCFSCLWRVYLEIKRRLGMTSACSPQVLCRKELKNIPKT